MSSILGIDLGGTKIAAARYDSKDWEIQDKERIQTQADKGFDHVIDELEQVIQDLRQEDTTAIGIGVPGLVHQPDGIILTMPNITGGNNIQLSGLISKSTGLPTIVDNDANCFALAESYFGAGKGHSVVIAITMGTGVGGGIVVDGKVFHGSTGFAGEFGHMLMNPGNPPYETDDKRGDVEQFLSGTAMGRRCEAAGNPEDYLEGKVCEFMRPDIFKEVAWLCTNLIHVLNPSVIVFGGSAGFALKPYLKDIEKELKRWTLPGTPLPELSIYRLTDAATRGAALLTI